MRDTVQSTEYFNSGITFKQTVIDEDKLALMAILRDEGKAMCVNSLFERAVRLTQQRFSRGDVIEQILPSVRQVAQMLSLRHKTMPHLVLSTDVREMWSELTLTELQNVVIGLAFMVGLRLEKSVLLETLSAINHAGQDGLLDRIAAKLGALRSPIASVSKFPTCYDALIEVIEADASERAQLLGKYVNAWYGKMKIASWHGNHKGEAYVGYWCFEAALVAMLWEIDDASFASHKYYPVDLVKHYRATK